jgi:hypothetical protein
MIFDKAINRGLYNAGYGNALFGSNTGKDILQGISKASYDTDRIFVGVVLFQRPAYE